MDRQQKLELCSKIYDRLTLYESKLLPDLIKLLNKYPLVDKEFYKGQPLNQDRINIIEPSEQIHQ